jgi:hypothetical protein
MSDKSRTHEVGGVDFVGGGEVSRMHLSALQVCNCRVDVVRVLQRNELLPVTFRV